MKKYFSIIIITYMKISVSQNVPFDNIWNDSLKPKSILDIKPMKSPQYYTCLKKEKEFYFIEKFSYETSDKIETVFSSQNYIEIKNLFSYFFSSDQNKLLLLCNRESIYRRSFLADYFILDLETKKLKKIDNDKIQEATFSPDGKFLIYSKNNNLYIFNVEKDITLQITDDGKKNNIINGISDWVYEEELQIVRAFCWNNSSDKVVYLKFNETKVKEVSMDILGDSSYIRQIKFKYPKAGEKNSDVSIHVYDLKSKKNQKIELGIKEELYFPRIYPYKKDFFALMTLNRKQNDFKILSLEEKINVLYSEKNDTYVDIPELNFIDNDFIISSEKDGFNHLYHYKEGKEIRQITKGNWDVLDLYGYDKNTNNIFFKSNISGAENQILNSIKIDGTDIKYLSSKEGINNAYFNSDFSYFIKLSSNDSHPPKYTLEDFKKQKTLKIIEDNNELLEKISKYNLPKKEFISIELENNVSVDAYILKPNNFNNNIKYPLFIYLYGGPGSRNVYDNWSNDLTLYLKYLSNLGYVVAVVETRGTAGKGEKYKKVTHLKLGHYETIDLINTAKELSKKEFIDKNKIGVFGWSYGGYMSSLAMMKGGDVFSLGISVAPVTDWAYYNTIYTERFLDTPQINPNGYKENSPLNFVQNLSGKYLLIHGAADDNVHLQNSMVMAKKLIEIDKPFEFFIYPDKDHSIKGGKTRSHLFKKITNFIKENL